MKRWENKEIIDTFGEDTKGGSKLRYDQFKKYLEGEIGLSIGFEGLRDQFWKWNG